MSISGASSSLGSGSLGVSSLGFGSSYELLGTERLLMFIRLDPTLRALGGVLSNQAQRFIDSCIAIREAFDLDTATGDRLDKIGSLLILPRYGLSDDDYRVQLKIQILLVLTSTATASTMIEIAELFTGNDVTSYAEAYPMTFRVGAQVSTQDEADRLLALIGKAKGGAYKGNLGVRYRANALVCGSTVTPLGDAGVCGTTGAAAIATAYEMPSVRATP